MEPRVKILLLAWLALAATLPPHPDSNITLGFDGVAPGATLPSGWRDYRMSRHKPSAQVSVARAPDGDDVLHIDADQSAGAVARHLDLPAATTLQWRWKVNHSVNRANIAHRSGDDAAARVYVFFAVPRKSLSWYQRMKLDVARHVLGHPMPTAAICYIWDNHHAVGSIARSPFFSGVRTIVLQSGNRHAGTWQVERRDLAADYRAAFGRAPPHVSGIAVAADTDNTRSDAQAWFGALTLTPDASSSHRGAAP
jgi:hypothetical protein